MSWTTTGKRCEYLEEDSKYMRGKISSLEGQLGPDRGFRGDGHLSYCRLGCFSGLNKGDLYTRLGRLEERFARLERYLGIREETTAEHTDYHKDIRKPVK